MVCDQFEAIFDETVTASERAAFCEAMRTMVLTGRVWVIATLRADFFSRCFGAARAVPRPVYRTGRHLRGRRAASGRDLPDDPPASHDGGHHVRASRRSAKRDSTTCCATPLRATPTVLPLLQFTLHELWRRSGGSGVLRFSDYEELGGLHGASAAARGRGLCRAPGSGSAPRCRRCWPGSFTPIRPMTAASCRTGFRATSFRIRRSAWR